MRLRVYRGGGVAAGFASALRLSCGRMRTCWRALSVSFRAEFGGEMSPCSRTAAGPEAGASRPAGVCRLLTRVALDMIVRPRPVGRATEDDHEGTPADRRGLWLVDHGLAMAALPCCAVGAATSRWAMSLGWAARRSPFSPGRPRTEGFAVPRPGRVAIRTAAATYPPPSNRRGERVSLRPRGGPERGGWSDVNTVLDRPKGTDGFEPRYDSTPRPHGWSLRGRVPVDDLRSSTTGRFSTSCADRSSALSSAGV